MALQVCWCDQSHLKLVNDTGQGLSALQAGGLHRDSDRARHRDGPKSESESLPVTSCDLRVRLTRDGGRSAESIVTAVVAGRVPATDCLCSLQYAEPEPESIRVVRQSRITVTVGSPRWAGLAG